MNLLFGYSTFSLSLTIFNVYSLYIFYYFMNKYNRIDYLYIGN